MRKDRTLSAVPVDDMEVLTVTTFFPNSSDRQRAVFIKNLVLAMRELCSVTVVAPVPFAPPLPWVSKWYAQNRIPREEVLHGMKVWHPRFVVVPKLGWLSGLGYFLGILPVIWRAKRSSTHRHFVVHAHCAYPDGVGVALAARMLKLPYVITAHGSDINVYARQRSHRAQIAWALSGANGIIAVSQALGRKIGDLIGARQKQVKYIPCAGFSADLFFPRNRREVRDRLPVSIAGYMLVYIGHLVPIKGVDVLIDAWSRLRSDGIIAESDRLIIIGSGRCRKTLEHQATIAGVMGSVLFLGEVPHVEISHWLAAADALCLPSRNEGTPNVVVEALASGVPVVATSVGGVPEIVSHGVNGALVEPENAEALSQGIRYTRSRHWDVAVLARSVEHLTWGVIAERNCRFLHSVIHGASNDSVA